MHDTWQAWLPAAYLPILQSSHQQNSLPKSQYAMHQREQLRSKHQVQQMENQKEISKASQENESLLTVPAESKKYATRRKK